MDLLIKECLVIAVGGAFGSVARFTISRMIGQALHHHDYPWGIFAVNVLGCLLVGLLAGFLIHRMQVGPLWRAGILIGFLGGFTTFSSFSLDTISLLQAGDAAFAVANILLTLVCCLVATAGGLLLTKSLF